MSPTETVFLETFQHSSPTSMLPKNVINFIFILSHINSIFESFNRLRGALFRVQISTLSFLRLYDVKRWFL